MEKSVLFNYSLRQKLARFLMPVVLLSSCGSSSDQSEAYQELPQKTDFILLTKNNAGVSNTYPGMLEGTVNVDIKAQVTGYLEQIYVSEGEYVEKGQNLFKIKGDVFNEQVNNSGAVLKSAIASQQSAALEVEKLKPLVEGKVVSDVQLKEAQAKYDAATAQVSQAKAALGSSQINASFAVIKAPVSGYIGRIPNRTGNLVSPGDAIPLTTLSDIHTVLVYFSMSEADFIAYRKSPVSQDSIELIMADGSVYGHRGKLLPASGNIDRNTGSLAMKAEFPNPDKFLRSGGSGRVVIYKTLADVLMVPKTSVKDIQDRYFVFKLADSNRVSMTPIEIAGSSGLFYLIKNGLQQGDKIAINRIDLLNEGAEVIPTVKTSKP